MRKIAASGLDRVEFRRGDFMTDELPRADIITMGNILHDWGTATKEMLIAKAYAALPTGGTFIAIENIIDDARRENAFGLLMSLNMLIETAEGYDYIRPIRGLVPQGRLPQHRAHPAGRTGKRGGGVQVTPIRTTHQRRRLDAVVDEPAAPA